MTLRIGIPLYPQFDTIDVAAPWDILSRVNQYAPDAGIELILVSQTGGLVESGQGLELMTTATFENCPHLDVLFIPGTATLEAIIDDERYIEFLRRRGAAASYVVAVCTGAVLAAKAGLLDGHRATTHWAVLDRLRKCKKVTVANGYPRWVECGNRLTTGGVSSSIDGTLRLVELLTGSPAAGRCIQLEIQYNPHPPYTTGDPSVADFETYERVMETPPPACRDTKPCI